MSGINYLQALYFNYNEKLTRDVVGYVMAFPNLELFNLHYGEPHENAPTTPLLDIVRLLLPQIRVINSLMVSGKPNPAAFLAYEPVPGEILALIFRRWVKVCYPESKHETLIPLCTADKFCWTTATPELLEYWAPSWAIALELSRHEYQLGNSSFKLLFSPGRKANLIEIVSWSPFYHQRGYRASVSLTISTQSDIDVKKINLHFGMKRWLVKQGDTSGIRLERGTTCCYVRRLCSWLGDYNLLEPNSFSILEANYRREGNVFIPQWKSQRVTQILSHLAVNIPEIANVLNNPLDFVGTDKMDVLVPARGYQKAGWGTGLPFSDQRNFLKQIRDFLPFDVVMSEPWGRISAVGELRQAIKRRFQKTPNVSRPSEAGFPTLNTELREFLIERANNLTILVCCRTDEVQQTLVQVAQHYFGDSLALNFLPLDSLADPISCRESRRGGEVPETHHIRQFGQQNQPEAPTPIIIEILPQDHPSYRNGKDPKSHIKSILPHFNLVPQCIVSNEIVTGDEYEKDETQSQSLQNRALAAIIDAILPFNQNYPLSISNDNYCSDNTVYAGFYIIRRNERTASQCFNEPVLVAIYKNQVDVLLPARDLLFRSMADAVCELAQYKSIRSNADQVVNNMLSALCQNYLSANDIYLFVHSQNARTYWTWLQDAKFDLNRSPSNKIHIIRIRDQGNYEVPQAYGLPTSQEAFVDGVASFPQGIFIPAESNLNEGLFTRTVLSIAKKAETNKLPKQMSRFQPWVSKGYKEETDEDGKPLVNKDGKPVRMSDASGKRISKDIPHNPSPTKSWKTPQPRAHNILATPSPEQFKLHHIITHDLRSRHWWTSAECEYPLPLSLAAKLKEWYFSESESEDGD